MESYKTVLGEAVCSFKEKKSEFIGFCFPVDTESAALAALAKVKALHPMASHHVYAYILRQDNISRFSDDGEPQGTAGLPALDLLKNLGLRDVCVVIVRYFGGTLLHTGGLVRAYSKSAKLAAEAAGVGTLFLCEKLSVLLDYSLYRLLLKRAENMPVKIADADFGEAVTITAHVRKDAAADFCQAIAEISAGGATVSRLGEIFCALD